MTGDHMLPCEQAGWFLSFQTSIAMEWDRKGCNGSKVVKLLKLKVSHEETQKQHGSS